MSDVIDRTFGIIDETGTVISCSELGRIGEVQSNAVAEVFDSDENKFIDGYTYKVFNMHIHPAYAVFVEGDDHVAEKYVGVLSVSLSTIKQYYDEKYDRGNFIKNVILYKNKMHYYA